MKKSDTIRQASVADIPRLIDLLHQVNMVHHRLRPDLFKPNTTKYNEQELETLLGDESKPIFVYDDGEVLGYAFCQIAEVKDDRHSELDAPQRYHRSLIYANEADVLNVALFGMTAKEWREELAK